jgi:predicted transcriptional regulator
MTKILKVVKPFFVMEAGDTFEYDAESKQYKSVYNEEHNGSDEGDTSVFSSYNSVYAISEEYAKMLIEKGFLAEAVEKKQNFVNIFEEINNLIVQYNAELDQLLKSEDDVPQCLKVEKETVLRNMIKLLIHLNSLKK